MLQVVSVISNIVAYRLSPVFSLSPRKSRHPLSGWLINISWHFKLGICSRPCFAYPCWHLRAWTGLGVNVCWFCFQRGNLLLEPICVLPSSCTGDGIASACWCGCLQVAFPPKHLQLSSQHLCSLMLWFIAIISGIKESASEILAPVKLMAKFPPCTKKSDFAVWRTWKKFDLILGCHLSDLIFVYVKRPPCTAKITWGNLAELHCFSLEMVPSL